MKTSTYSEYTTLAENKIHKSLSALERINWNKLTRDINDKPLPLKKANLVRAILSTLIKLTQRNIEVCSIKGEHIEDRMPNPPLYVPVHIAHFYQELPVSSNMVDDCFDYLYEAFEITYIGDHTLYFWPTRLLKLVDHN